MSKLHVAGLSYINDTKIDKMKLIIGEKVNDAFTQASLLRAIED